MTLITGQRIIKVVVDRTVILVSIRRVMFVTVNAGIRRRVSSRMALGARQIMITRQREERCVIKRRRRPSRGRVAFRTIL